MEVYKNSFDGGLDTNISTKLIQPNKYIDAANVNIAADGNFFALENIKGTTDVKTILGTGDYEVLGVYSTRYTISDIPNIPCLTIITAVNTEVSTNYDSTFKIWCYAIGSGTLYQLYERAIVPADYFKDDRLLDGFLYPEAGKDILYFTDNFFKIGKLRCVIPTGYTPNFLKELDVQLQRTGALGLANVTSIEEGGSLFCGSYQIAYQLVNPDTNQYTKFSLFCNPIQIFLKPSDAFEKTTKSGVGLQSNYKIVFNINLSEREADYFTHFRLAVLENIEPSGVNVSTAQLTSIELISDFLTGTTLTDVEYNANVRLETIDVSEIVVDLMALDHAKTLSVRENRLLAGNISLRSLDYDNGSPAISGGTVIKAISANTKNSFADPLFASTKRGHFREEVYRYAIAYFDEDLNFSFPKVLDLSAIDYNQFGIGPVEIPPTNPELIQDPTLLSGGVYWINYDWEGDPGTEPQWNVGGGAVATLPLGAISTQYLRQAITLDHTKTYDYELDFSNTFPGTSWNFNWSFWNGTTKLSEFIVAGSGIFTQGSFSPPQFTTHIGLRLFSVTGPGDFTIEQVSLKVSELAGPPVPPTTVTGFDVRFPGRNSYITGNSFTIFDNSGNIQSLGLRLEDIDNHPTWARGFVILRANRIKDIQFQTPLIPMNKVYGVGPIEEYPQQANEISGTGRRVVEYPSAQPMGPFETYVPRNYHWKNAQDLEMYSVAGGATGAGLNQLFTGETRAVLKSSYSVGMIYPPEFLYQNTPFVFSPTYRARTVDAILTDRFNNDFSNLSIGSTVRGRNIKTSMVSSFYALEDDRHYYDSQHNGVKPLLRTSDSLLTDYNEFVNFAEPGTVGGFSVFNYDKLDTPGIFWGTKATVNKCGVLKLDSSKTEINSNSALAFAAGVQVSKAGNATIAFDTVNQKVQTFEIVNIVAGLEDTRYGKETTPHEYIFTGTMVTFTEAELPTVAAGTTLPKTVDVWGGDCYVTPHLFKISDTNYGLSNSEKHEGIGGLNLLNGVRNWEKSFNDLNVASECNMSIPVPYKNSAQFLQVVLESEYNAGVMDNEIISTVTTTNTDFPIFAHNSSSEQSCRVPLSYELNQNHKKQNSDKIFRIKDPLLEVNNNFIARVVYTDQKVYQTSINGFDIFRVLNFYDLQEAYGAVHALALAGDDLYALQEKAVVYIGIGERTLETTDALLLSVQSGSFIGTVMYVTVNKGTQHLKSVIETGSAIYFIDNRNKTFNRLAGKQLDIISEATVATTFREYLVDSIAEKELLTLYDPTHKQLFVSSHNATDQFCLIYDEARSMWVSRYDFAGNSLLGGAYSSQNLYLLGKTATELNVYSMYTGDYGQLFGTAVVPSVSVIVNPNMEVAKVFDALLLPGDNPLKAYDVSIGDPDSQVVSNSTLVVPTRGEGNFKTVTLRDGNGARIRGLNAKFKLKWHNSSDDPSLNVAAKLPSLITKYRISENRF